MWPSGAASRIITPLAILMVTIGVSVALYLTFLNQNRSAFNIRQVLPLVSALLKDQPRLQPMPKSEWDRLASLLPRNFPLGNLGRRVVVNPEERETFENATGSTLSYLGTMGVPTPRRHASGPSHLPTINSVVPEAVGTEPRPEDGWYRSIMAARDSGGTAEYLFSSSIMGTYACGIDVPIYAELSRPNRAVTREQHRQAVRGFTYMILPMPGTIAYLLGALDPIPMAVRVTVPAEKVELLKEHGGTVEESIAGRYAVLASLNRTSGGTEVCDDWALTTHLSLGGSTLTVRWSPLKSYVDDNVWQHHKVLVLPIIILVFGAVLALLSIYVLKQLARLEEAWMVAESALSSRSKFLSYQAHELRNPLNAIQGLVEWLHDTDLSDEQREYVNGLETCGAHMMKIINDTLDLGKLEAGKVVFDSAELDLCEILLMLAKMFKKQAEEKGLDFFVKTDPHVPRHVYGDHTRLAQILSNITANAVRMTERGTVAAFIFLAPSETAPTIDARDHVGEDYKDLLPRFSPDAPRIVHSSRDEGQGATVRRRARNQGDEKQQELTWLEFQIVDTGPGIPEELLPRLFQPYSQPVPTVGEDAHRSTGLGLSFVKALTRCWGGRLYVLSEVGRGTAFIVRLPVRTASEEIMGDCLDAHLLITPKLASASLSPRSSTSSLCRLCGGCECSKTHSPSEHKADSDRRITQTLSLSPPTLPSLGRDHRSISSLSPPMDTRLMLSQTAAFASHPARERTAAAAPLAAAANSRIRQEEEEGPISITIAVAAERPDPAQHELLSPEASTETGSSSIASRSSRAGTRPPGGGALTANADVAPAAEQAGAGTSSLSTLSAGSGTQLAATATASPARVSEGAGAAAQEGEDNRPVILVVDDSPLNQKIVARKLTKLGCASLLAGNGKEAIEVYHANRDRVRLILMDLQMPVMDGHEATIALRKERCDVPIAALTGSVSEEERQRCKQGGMQDFLPKPIQDDELIRVLQRLDILPKLARHSIIKP